MAARSMVTTEREHTFNSRSPLLSKHRENEISGKEKSTCLATLFVAVITILILSSVISNGNATQPESPINAVSPKTTFNLYNFEEKVLPKYINKFAIDIKKGLFKYSPSTSNKTAYVYGIVDMIHILYLVGQNDVYLSDKKILNSWINHIHSYQNSTGFYKLQPLELSSPLLYQPWHSTAYITSALYILNAKPKYNNTYYANIAKNKSLWNETFYPLLNYTEGLKLGCFDIHYCCHKIVSIPSTLIHEGNGKIYNEFISWWFNDFIYPNLNPKYGTLCPEKDIEEAGLKTCLGSGAALHFFDTFTNTPYPYARKVFDFIELLSRMATESHCKGFFDPTCNPSKTNRYISNMDGITQLTNSAKQLNYYKWDTVVKSKCREIIEFYVPKLNNESYVLNEWTDTSLVLSPVVAAVAQCIMEFPDIVQTKYSWRCCVLGM